MNNHDLTTKGTKGTKLNDQPVHEALDALSKHIAVEVDQQAQPITRAPEVTEKLSLVNRDKLLYSLQFHYHAGFNNEIKPLTVDLNVLVLHGDGNLPSRRQSAKLELVNEGFLIHRFEQSRSKVPVYLDGRTNDAVAGLVKFRRNGVHRVCPVS